MMDIITILGHFAKARYLMRTIRTKEDLERRQAAGLYRFRRDVLRKSPFYAPMWNDPFARFPIMDKASTLADFDRLNTGGIHLENAMDAALRAERERDFSPTLNGITVGLSSGTSGKRGIFVASKAERMKWAGVMLAKALPGSLLVPHRIAFFLRANSNLYTTLGQGRHITFDFYDLTRSMSDLEAALNRNPPSILTAPASVLRALAEARSSGRIHVSPSRIYSVAEVLEPDDEAFISAAFDIPVRQIYQCTEGFLGISHEEGRIRLNEEYLIVEKEWVDREAGRFVPIITDFTRSTQPVVRYRLDDILVEDRSHAGPFTVLNAIEGRCDDALHFQSAAPGLPISRIFADTIRQAIASSAVPYDDYGIVQDPCGRVRLQFTPALQPLDQARAIRAFSDMAEKQGALPPDIVFEAFPGRDRMKKFRRITRIMA